MSEPTKQQIDQADRLQKAGLCQNSEQWILNRYKTQDYSIQKKTYAGSPWFITGPLPTFEEVWVELQPLLREKNLEMPLTGYAFFLIQRDKIVLRQYHFENHTPTTAAIEALLLLKAASGKQILTKGE